MSSHSKKPSKHKSTVSADTLKQPETPSEALKEGQTADTSKNQTPEFDALMKQHDQLQTEIEQWKALCARSQADAENARKRAAQEIATTRQFGTQSLIKALLPVLDSLEKGIDNCSEEACQHPIAGPITEGLKLTFTMLLDTLAKEGVTKVHPLNKPFDPHFHEAIGTDAESQHPSNTVTQVLQTGYRLKDRALRPALVMVSK